MAAEPCIKTSVRGDASTYNPFLPGWRTGGGKLATGGWYNPNEYAAALQLDLAKQYRCGYGGGAICHAVVQAPNGRAMTVRVNDNGPLVSGRVIDLNEKSMRYLSGGAYGQNSGVIKNVTVTLLCGIENQPLGPLDPKDREAWASRTFDAPYVSQSLYNQASPVGFPAGSIANQAVHPSTAGGYPAAAPASAPASSGASYPVSGPIPLSSSLSPSLNPPEPPSEEVQSQAVSDLLLALTAPTSSAGSFSVGMPLLLTERIGSENASGLSAGSVSSTSSGLSLPSATVPQSADTFGVGYQSPDLRWSAWNAAPFFRPFFLEIESMIRSILDLIQGL